MADGYKSVFRVSDAFLHDAEGVRTEGVPDSIVWAILSTLKDRQEVGEDGFVQSFVASGGMTRAQLILRTAVSFSLKDEERIHWKAVGDNLDGVLRCEELLHDAKTRFGTFMSYIIHQQPKEIPPFLPAGWKGRSAQGPAPNELGAKAGQKAQL